MIFISDIFLILYFYIYTKNIINDYSIITLRILFLILPLIFVDELSLYASKLSVIFGKSVISFM